MKNVWSNHQFCPLEASHLIAKPYASRLYAMPFVQARFKENIKATRHWPLWGDSTGDRWFLLTEGSNQWYHGKCFHLMTSSCDRVTGYLPSWPVDLRYPAYPDWWQAHVDSAASHVTPDHGSYADPPTRTSGRQTWTTWPFGPAPGLATARSHPHWSEINIYSLKVLWHYCRHRWKGVINPLNRLG